MNRQEFTSNNPEETLRLGENIGRQLNQGDVVLLFGDLGAGKTLLTQGIARGLGLEEKEYIRSPSFTLINEYKAKYPIYHIDLYRIESLTEIENLGLEEIFSGNGVTIVEWAEKLYKTPGDTNTLALPIDKKLEIHIIIQDDDARHFKVSPKT
jgi:tRNA threonylcarbamoyladenosine biosynthesis protein TsaE